MGSSFAIVSGQTASIAEQEVENPIAEAMTAKGLTRAVNIETADIAVVYSMSIGSGHAEAYSSPDFFGGGQKVHSYTEYERYMQIMLYDVKGMQDLKDAKILWQAEISSLGSNSNYITVGERFVSIIFKNFGKTNINDSFYRIVTN
jgi:hypothetical protein